MNDTAKEKFDKAKLLDLNSADAERMKFLYAWEIRNDDEAIEAAETAWRRNTIQPYIKGMRLILDAALEDEWFNDKVREQDDYLMLGQIATLGKHDAAPLLSELMGGELELWRVLETVKRKRTRKPREKQDKSAALKDAREIIELLTEIGIEWDDVENAMSMANEWMDKYGGKP